MYRASVAFLIMVVSSAAAAQTIVVSKLSQAPEIDGNGFEWRGVSSHRIVLTPTRPESKLEGPVPGDLFLAAGALPGEPESRAQSEALAHAGGQLR